MCRVLLLCLLMWAQAGARAASPAAPVATVQEDVLYEQSIALFKQRDFAQAALLLSKLHEMRPGDADVALLLGIARYRLNQLSAAEPLLALALERGDEETRASARLFLGLIHRAQGALDRAQQELARAAADSRVLGTSISRLARGAQRRILSGSLLVSPEYDGNVRLTDRSTWSQDQAGSSDGDLLLVGTLTLRPFRSVGLSLSHALTYRQQFRLHDFSLLLDTTTLGYSYLGERHRVRASLAFTYSMMGGSTFYFAYDGRAAYRLRLWRKLGVGLSYLGVYRDYRQPDFMVFSGHTHTIQVELSHDVVPAPLSASLGYLVVRDQLAPPSSSEPRDDYRATSHGPALRLLGRPHRLIDLMLISSLLFRRFDAKPVEDDLIETGALRQDIALSADLSITVECTGWLEVFAGGALLFNHSNDAAFAFIKPTAYAGVTASFAAF